DEETATSISSTSSRRASRLDSSITSPQVITISDDEEEDRRAEPNGEPLSTPDGTNPVPGQPDLPPNPKERSSTRLPAAFEESTGKRDATLRRPVDPTSSTHLSIASNSSAALQQSPPPQQTRLRPSFTTRRNCCFCSSPLHDAKYCNIFTTSDQRLKRGRELKF
ncbi:hypothetical protein PFISCL1PPCAC_12481, partial [Pristionchus fissidentatus]